MNEYDLEDERPVDTARLRVGRVGAEDYRIAHRTMSFVCHDIVVRLGDRYLLVERDGHPAKGVLWPLGGRLERGVPVGESLAGRVLAESGLRVSGLRFLGVARTTFGTDPLGHGAGTDTVNLMYTGDGAGEIRLDLLHSSPTLFTAAEYRDTLRPDLHPYVVEILDLALAC